MLLQVWTLVAKVSLEEHTKARVEECQSLERLTQPVEASMATEECRCPTSVILAVEQECTAAVEECRCPMSVTLGAEQDFRAP